MNRLVRSTGDPWQAGPRSGRGRSIWAYDPRLASAVPAATCGADRANNKDSIAVLNQNAKIEPPIQALEELQAATLPAFLGPSKPLRSIQHQPVTALPSFEPQSAVTAPKLHGIKGASQGMVNNMLKRRLLMVAVALAVGSSVAGAQERLGPAGPGARVLPAHEIITILRSTGFDPVGRPVPLGSRYEVQAIDPDDFEVRLLVDGRTGRILTVRDSEVAWPMEPPPYPREGFRQAAGRFGPLSYGPLRPDGLVPPRGIPARRSSATLEPQKAPVPRPRPEARREPAVASTALPGTPAASVTASAPSTSAAPTTANAPNLSAPPSAGNAGIKGTAGAISGDKENTTSTAANMPATRGPAHTLPRGGPPAPDAAAAAKTSDANKVVPVAPLE